MSEKYSFFNSELIDGNYDRVYLAEDYARYFKSFIGNGIYANPSTNLQVTVNGVDMVITVASGKAWINGYFYENTNNLLFTLSNADGVLKRIDSIVVQLDLINRHIKTVVKTGVFSVNPQVSELIRNDNIYEVQLATVYIGAGVIKINQANITDTRHNISVCGIVSGVVDQIDTTGLFSQYTDAFNIWFNNLKNKLGTDIAGNLQLEIDAINGSKGVANGLASLDANGKLAQMPSTSDIGAAKRSILVAATLLASGWTGTVAPFSIQVTVIGITATSINEIAPTTNITEAQLTALQSANIVDGGQAINNITLLAYGYKPEIDIPIRVIIRGDM